MAQRRRVGTLVRSNIQSVNSFDFCRHQFLRAAIAGLTILGTTVNSRYNAIATKVGT